MAAKKKPDPSANKNISIGRDVVDSVVINGDNNMVNQTTIQKFFNIFKSDSETLEHRNHRILLGHVENAWIKGVLDASLHGAALLDLGIKQDPEAVTKYPWAIKRESTDETLPAGTSMLEIFDSIGMGRSLLILGAPGSGKTTMLLELARQLIAHAREDVTYPIPMVFNLASWTEKLTLPDWLAQELNNLYSVPRKTAPEWVKGDKLLLLLDGLDEVRQESRAKCVEAINSFRKEHGMTSLAVCSRSQDYADLNTKLSFEGAIEVQPLTQKQITEFFNRFGKEMAGIKQILKKDNALREMAETPLFLSIMIMAYRDKQDVEILVSQDEKAQRKHLFNNYIGRMFERPRLKNVTFKKKDLMSWLSWLACKLTKNDQSSFLIENIKPEWLGQKNQSKYLLIVRLLFGLSFGMLCWLSFGMITWFGFDLIGRSDFGLPSGLGLGLLCCGLPSGLYFGYIFGWFLRQDNEPVDAFSWNLRKIGIGPLMGLPIGLFYGLVWGRVVGLLVGLLAGLLIWLLSGMDVKKLETMTRPGQRLFLSATNSLFAFLLLGLLGGLFGGPIVGLFIGIFFLPMFGGGAVIQHYVSRLILARNNLLPWRLVPFLDHCVDLIFLRRVGGGYIFVHRLLMEHFAEMYVETPTSKGN